MRRPPDSTTSAWISSRSRPFGVTNGASHAWRASRSGVASGTMPAPGIGSSSSVTEVILTEPTFHTVAGIRPPHERLAFYAEPVEDGTRGQEIRMADQGPAGVKYERVGDEYFQQRKLRRYAGVFSLWALGVGAVISGHFSGWNYGLGFGWGSMFLATILITLMYLGLTYSLAEMSPALPHTGGAYSFARSSMGPWGGFVTGVAENIEYVLTPAVVVFFIGSYLGAILETGPEIQPVYWILGYATFVGANLFGVELSFRVTVFVTLGALACLVFFYLNALPELEFTRWAMNVGVG